MRYVYTSDIAPPPEDNAICAKCETPVVQRLGFKVPENGLNKGVCSNCRERLPGVWV